MNPLQESYESWPSRVGPIFGSRIFYCLALGNYHLNGKENEWISLSVGDWTSLRWKKITNKRKKEKLIWKSMKKQKFIFFKGLLIEARWRIGRHSLRTEIRKKI